MIEQIFPKYKFTGIGLPEEYEKKVIRKFNLFSIAITIIYTLFSLRDWIVGDQEFEAERLVSALIAITLFLIYFLINNHEKAKVYIAIVFNLGIFGSFFSYGGVTGLFAIDLFNLLIFTFLVFQIKTVLRISFFYVIVFGTLFSLQSAHQIQLLPPAIHFTPEIDAIIFIVSRLILTGNMILTVKYHHNLERAELLDKNNEIEALNEELKNTLENLNSTQQQLIHTEKMASLGIMSAGIGHEINNPLNFIKTGVDLIDQEIKNQKLDSNQDLVEYVKIIKEGATRVASITKSLKQISRGGADMDEECDIYSIIDNCVVILNHKIKDRIEIIRNYGVENFIVKGNSGKLHQAILNLVSNAEQAIDGNGKITFNSYQNGEFYVLTISDNGSGISEEVKEKIMNPFFTTKPPGEGTGLGLSITYGILNEHKGKITFDSVENKGTTFEISLPF